MAEEAKKLGAAMIHYSTDYVFDGKKSSPYLEADATCPINVYGATKLAGERAIQNINIPHLILRTSWVYGMRGKNFLLTILRLANEREELGIVSDQYGAPTWCRTIADLTGYVVSQSQIKRWNQEDWHNNSGVYHLTAQGQTTWFEFTKAILKNTENLKDLKVKPIKTVDYPLPAKRPEYSVLSSEKFIGRFCTIPEWESALKLCVVS
jgi:dTDP-4-dehydrorhamnose reductase